MFSLITHFGVCSEKKLEEMQKAAGLEEPRIGVLGTPSHN